MPIMGADFAGLYENVYNFSKDEIFASDNRSACGPFLNDADVPAVFSADRWILEMRFPMGDSPRNCFAILSFWPSKKPKASL